MTVKLFLKCRPVPGVRGYLYDVMLSGETIISARDPEYTACRWLLDHGYEGEAAFWREGKNEPDIVISSIAKGAAVAAYEDWRRGLRIRKYVSHPDT